MVTTDAESLPVSRGVQGFGVRIRGMGLVGRTASKGFPAAKTG
jgi:hypothetical protein